MGLRPIAFAFLALSMASCSRVLPAPELSSKESPLQQEAKSSETKTTTASKTSDFQTQVVPFVNKYCFSCHNDKKKSSGLSLEKYKNEKDALKDRKVWQEVVDNIHSKEMPPEDAKAKPTAAEREKIETIIVEQLTKVDCGLSRDPGHPTIRRLNRAEYANTIRDLVGVSFNPSDDFPTDDVGYGFDNIGDVLSMPPILLEKYMRAAERIMDEAIQIPGDSKPSKHQYKVQALQATIKARDPVTKPVRLLLNQPGAVFTNFEPVQEGDYTIKVDAFAENNTGEVIKMVFKVDGKEQKTVEVKAGTQQKPERFDFKAHLAGDKHRIEMALGNPLAAKPKANEKRNLSITYMEIEGPFNGVPKPLSESHKRIMVSVPKSKYEEEDSARTIIKTFASKAYRRPVTTFEVDRLMKLYRALAADKEPFEKCVSFALRAVLVSPNFLFRIEQDADPKNASAVHTVNEFELASRLSYFLWSTMPDDALTQLAAKGELRKPGVLEAQIARMLKDPRAKALTKNFASQWLQLRTLDMLEPDKKVFPESGRGLKNLLMRETETYFEYIVKEDRSILEFLDSNYTFLNDRLAQYYGLPGVNGGDLQKVTFKDGVRGGLLTQGSILMLTSNPTRTSPVKRGKWILETILGTPPPPPPPDVPDLKEGAEANASASLRERMVKHRENAVCASCHSKMDPLGFGLENFNAVGAWRDRDGKFKIDATGVLPGGEKFDGPAQLRKVLLGKADLFRRNLADKLLTYGLGRGTEFYDKCAIDEIVKSTASNKDRFSALVTAIVKSDPFQKRRGRED